MSHSERGADSDWRGRGTAKPQGSALHRVPASDAFYASPAPGPSGARQLRANDPPAGAGSCGLLRVPFRMVERNRFIHAGLSHLGD
jgi:hypothetical protein